MIVNNVRLVLENEVVSGSLEMRGGRIASFSDSGSQQPGALDGGNAFCCRGWSNCIPTTSINSLRHGPKSTGGAFGDEQSRCTDGRQRHHYGAGRHRRR